MAVGFMSELEPCELLVEPAFEVRVERRFRAGLGRAAPLQGQANRPYREGAGGKGTEREDQGKSPEALLGGVAKTPGPNSSTSAPLISSSESPAAMRSRMKSFI